MFNLETELVCRFFSKNSRSGDIMKKMDIARKIINQNGGIAKTSELNKAGLQNFEIAKLCNNGELERVKQGYYQIANQEDISEEKMITTFFKEGIVCMDSALFYYGYSDKTPSVWTIAVPRSVTRSKLKIDNFAYRVYFIQNDNLLLGKTEGIFNGVKLPVYDRERTICDCFKYRTKMDRELFDKAVNAYIVDDNKNLGNLFRYAEKMRVYKKVHEVF